MKSNLIITIIVFVVSGCVNVPRSNNNPPQFVWQKSGATTEEFNKIKYICLQESQQRKEDAYIGAYGGSSSSQVITNPTLFSACMNAQGWYLSQVATTSIQQAKPDLSYLPKMPKNLMMVSYKSKIEDWLYPYKPQFDRNFPLWQFYHDALSVAEEVDAGTMRVEDADELIEKNRRQFNKTIGH